MREIFLGVLLLFTCGPASAQLVQAVVSGTPASSGIVIVQHKSTFCLSATTCALAFTSNVGAGHMLVYFVGMPSGSITAATDNNTNTISNVLTNTGHGTERIDYVSSSNSGATTVTGNSSTSGEIHIHIWEISGLASGLKDATGTTTQTGTALTVTTSGSITATNEIVFGFFICAGTNVALTAGSGFTVSEFTNDTTDGDSGLTEAMVVSSSGTQTATATAGTSQAMDNIVVTFK